MTVFKTLFALLVLVSTSCSAVLPRDFLFPERPQGDKAPVLFLGLEGVLCTVSEYIPKDNCPKYYPFSQPPSEPLRFEDDNDIPKEMPQISPILQDHLDQKGQELTPIFFRGASDFQYHLYFPFAGEMILWALHKGFQVVVFHKRGSSNDFAIKDSFVPFFMKTLEKYFRDPTGVWEGLTEQNRLRVMIKTCGELCYETETPHPDWPDEFVLEPDPSFSTEEVSNRSFLVTSYGDRYRGTSFGKGEYRALTHLDHDSSDRFISRLVAENRFLRVGMIPPERNGAYIVGILQAALERMKQTDQALSPVIHDLFKGRDGWPNYTHYSVPAYYPCAPEWMKTGEDLIFAKLITQRLTFQPYPLLTHLILESIYPQDSASATHPQGADVPFDPFSPEKDPQCDGMTFDYRFSNLNLWEQMRLGERLRREPRQMLRDKGVAIVRALPFCVHPRMQGEEYLDLVDILLGMTPERIRLFSRTFGKYKQSFFSPLMDNPCIMMNRGDITKLFKVLTPLGSQRIKHIARRARIFFPDSRRWSFKSMPLSERIRVIESLSEYNRKEIDEAARHWDEIISEPNQQLNDQHNQAFEYIQGTRR